MASFPSNEEIIRGILSVPWAQAGYGDRCTEAIRFSTADSLEKLRDASLPNSVHEAIQNVKKIYGYKKYMIDGKSATFDGLEVKWEPQTGAISGITIHLKGEGQDVAIGVGITEPYDMLSWRVGSPQKKNGTIHINTQEWIENVWMIVKNKVVAPRVRRVPPWQITPEALDDSQQALQTIARETKKNSALSWLNAQDSAYSGASLEKIEYAIIRQSDGEKHYYDRIASDGYRTAYRVSSNGKILAVAKINAENDVLKISGEAFTPLFNPRPISRTQNKK